MILRAVRRSQPLLPRGRAPAQPQTLAMSRVSLLMTARAVTVVAGAITLTVGRVEAQVTARTPAVALALNLAVPRVEAPVTARTPVVQAGAVSLSVTRVQANATARTPTLVVGGNYVYDTFTDTTGTALQSHTGEVGATWTKFAADPGPDVVISNAGRIYPSSATDSSAYSASGTPSSADYTVQADFVAVDTTNTVPSIWGRFDPDASVLTGYRLFYSIADGGWRLDRVSAAGTSQIGSTYSDTITSGNQRTARLEMNGSSIKAYIDGTERISGTNGDITAAGKAGLRFNGAGSNTTGIQLDNFIAAPLSTGTNLAVPRVTVEVTVRTPTLLAGAAVVYDSFTDTAGTNLQSHTGEVGATWTRYGPANNLVISDAGRLRGANAGAAEEAIYYASGTPVSADYEVEATVRFVTTAVTNPAVLGRMDTGAGSLTAYRVVYNNSAGGWQLRKVLAGTDTQVGSTTYSDSPTAGQDRHIRFRMEGASLKVFIDGTLRIDETDSSLTAAGKAGVRFNGIGSNSAGQHLDNFRAGTLTGAVVAVVRVAAMATARTPTVVAGAVSLAVPRITALLTARTPTVAAGAVTFSVSRVTGTITARTPAVAAGTVTRAVGRVEARLSARTPVVAATGVTLPVARVAAALTARTPLLAAGAVLLAPARIEARVTARTLVIQGTGTITLPAPRVVTLVTARTPLLVTPATVGRNATGRLALRGKPFGTAGLRGKPSGRLELVES